MLSCEQQQRREPKRNPSPSATLRLVQMVCPYHNSGTDSCRILIAANRDADSDTPFSLAAAVLEAIPVLAGTEKSGFAWTIYTGDLVSHDAENQLSR